MTADSEFFLGFDPGGSGRFGLAAIRGSKITYGKTSNIREAVDWSILQCGGKEPVAAGIDTLLHWGNGDSGFRSADIWLRKQYPKVQGSVMPPNSLRGAMTIGGIGLALELRQLWPKLLLNETHPKVLFHALTDNLYPRRNLRTAIEWFIQTSQLDFENKPQPSEDEFDAILSAWATREPLSGSWRDLTGADDSHIFPISGVRYWWPTPSVRPS